MLELFFAYLDNPQRPVLCLSSDLLVILAMLFLQGRRLRGRISFLKFFNNLCL